MGPLVDRTEFRADLDKPGITPLTPEQILLWFQNVTLADLQAVSRQLDEDKKNRSQ
jgi:hypothetical protein